MNNSLFNIYGKQQNNVPPIISEINKFKNSFKGDPKAEVEKMMQSGQLSQEQFNEYAQMANQLMQFFK